MAESNLNVIDPRRTSGEIQALGNMNSDNPGRTSHLVKPNGPAGFVHDEAARWSVSRWHQILWSHQFMRFLIVGAGNTVVGYLLYLAGLWIGLSYAAALTCSTILGATFNFFTTGRIVFKNKSLIRILGFFAIYGVTFAVNLVLLALLVEHGIAKAYAQLILLPVIAVLSFALIKYLVFGRRS